MRVTLELLFRSQFDADAVTRNSPHPIQGLFGVDLTPRLSAITLPVLLLWGTHDDTHWAGPPWPAVTSTAG